MSLKLASVEQWLTPCVTTVQCTCGTGVIVQENENEYGGIHKGRPQMLAPLSLPFVRRCPNLLTSGRVRIYEKLFISANTHTSIID